MASDKVEGISMTFEALSQQSPSYAAPPFLSSVVAFNCPAEEPQATRNLA
jgi:hypothetical protein